MKVVNGLYPTGEQLAALAQDLAPGPIAMVNLLRYRERAAYTDGRPTDLSGREAYFRYAAEMRGIVERGGGRFLFGGQVKALVIGEVEDLWDDVGIVEYPSVAAFAELVTSAEVQAAAVHREAGLAGQLLILTVAGDLAPAG